MRPLALALLLAACPGSPPPPPPDGGCVRAACAPGDCGERLDGCGGRVFCGQCEPGETCGGAGAPNRCGPGTCAAKSCLELHANCDFVSDGCARVLDCGRCARPSDCGANGTPNRCGGLSCVKPPCPPGACGPSGDDDCGGTLDCGACAAPQTCGGAGVAGRCGCTPKTCTALVAECGTVNDGCDAPLSCGTCSGATICGAGPRQSTCATCSAAGDRVCAPGCWCWDSPRPFAAHVSAIWVVSPSEVWFFTGGEAAVRKRGDRFEHFPLPERAEIHAAWGAAADDIWAVGVTTTPVPRPVILHFDGVSWGVTRAAPRFPVSAVWGTAANDVYAAARATVLHWDGAEWTEVLASASEIFSGVWGSAANDVWVASSSGARHFDGARWSSPNAIDALWAVHGTARDDVWAAGTSSLWRWNGVQWAAVTTNTRVFTRVLAITRDDAISHGNDGLMQWDGTRWTSLPATAPRSATALGASGRDSVWAANGAQLYQRTPDGWEQLNERGITDLVAVAAPSPTEQWALSSTAQVLRADGGAWHLVDRLSGVALSDLASAGGRTWAVGANGEIWTSTGGAFSPAQSGVTTHLTAVTALSATRAFAAGGPPATVLSWDGVQWAPISMPLNGQLTAVWASADAGALWVADTGGGVHQWNGTDWVAHPLPVTRTVTALWGADGELFAATRRSSTFSPGAIHRFHGGAWQLLMTIQNGDIEGISGTSPTDVWFTGRDGTVLRWDGAQLQPQPHRFKNDLNAVAATPDAVWAVGFRGTVARLERDGGAQLQPVQPFAAVDRITGLGGTSAGDVWLSTEAGAVYQRTGSSGVVHEVAGVAGSAGLGQLWANAADDVWVWTDRGHFVHWDGATWASVSAPPTASSQVRAMWGRARDDVWAVRDENILHWDGRSWSISYAEPSLVLNAIWGTAGDDVWAAGSAGLRRFDGTGWSRVQVTPSRGNTTVWCAARNDCWTADDMRQLFRWNGTTWSLQPLPQTHVQVVALTGTGPDDVHAFDSDGAVFRFDGARFERTKLPGGKAPAGVWAAPDGVWAAYKTEGLLFHPR